MPMCVDWDLAEPHVLEFVVPVTDIDRMGHVNNAAYVSWLERVAWDHTQARGLSWEIYQQHNRGFVARRTEVDYIAPAMAGDRLLLGTWIVENDQRLSMLRRYQIVRPRDGLTLLRARTRWICVAIDTGRPRRMPTAFAQAYPVTPGGS